MSIEGPRILDKVVDQCDIDMGESPAPIFPATMTGDDWEVLDAVATPTYVNRSFYDLSGLTREGMTLFLQGVKVQEGWGPRGTTDFFIMDIVSTEYLTDQQLTAAYIYTTGDGDPPGFMNSLYNMEQVIYGRTREFVVTSLYNQVTMYQSSNWGTGTATNADKLFITRVCYIVDTAVAGRKVHIPPSNFVTAGIVSKEKDLAYMMRLVRSYEHAGRS